MLVDVATHVYGTGEIGRLRLVAHFRQARVCRHQQLDCTVIIDVAGRGPPVDTAHQLQRQRRSNDGGEPKLKPRMVLPLLELMVVGE